MKRDATGPLFAALEKRAARLAVAKVRQRHALAKARRSAQPHAHWRSAPYLWPTFGSGG